MVKVRQVACPVSRRWTVGGTPDQSVAVNGSVGSFYSVTPGFPSRIIERYVGYWKPYATKRILLIEAGP
jgi:hypothetical protein